MQRCLACPEQRCVGIFNGDDEFIGLRPLGHDDVGLLVDGTSHAVPLALAQCVKVQPAMLAEHLAFQIHNESWLVRHKGAQEILHLHLPNEADALAVLFLRCLEAELARPLPQLRLEQMPDGELRDAHLMRLHHGKEVGLVLVRIGPAQDVPVLFACIVPGGDGLKAVLLRPVPEDTEFHLAVAHHIGIRRDAGLVAFKEVFHDLFAILRHEIDHSKRDAELLCHGLRIGDVLLPRAVADDVFLVDPVLHVHAGHVMPCADELGRGHAAVHASGHGCENLHGLRIGGCGVASIRRRGCVMEGMEKIRRRRETGRQETESLYSRTSGLRCAA